MVDSAAEARLRAEARAKAAAIKPDADPLAAVQAAIAAEPVPVHLPRERSAPVVLDDAPLVLVETKRDLAQMQLPIA